VTKARAHLSQLLWRVQSSREPISITRRGKAVAVLAPLAEVEGDWITALMEFREAHPEECREWADEIDRICAERRRRLCPYNTCPVDGQPSLPPLE